MSAIRRALENYHNNTQAGPGIVLATEALKELDLLEDDLEKVKRLIDVLIAKCPEARSIIGAYADAVIAERKEASHE